jgi:hypothetical protein
MCVFALLFLELRREIDWPTREVDARCHGVVDCESEFAGKKETPAGSRREFRWMIARLWAHFPTTTVCRDATGASIPI